MIGKEVKEEEEDMFTRWRPEPVSHVTALVTVTLRSVTCLAFITSCETESHQSSRSRRSRRYLYHLTVSAMNETSSSLCTVSLYLNLCASSKVPLLVPGFGLNIVILASLVSCLLSQRGKIRGDVAVFILASTSCNLVNLSLWPMMVHWRNHGRWLLGSSLCNVMVSAKHLTSSASFHYVSFITFSTYLMVVCGCRRLVNSRWFLGLQLLFPLFPVGMKELVLWLSGGRVEHLDPVNLTCFSFINDEVMRVLLLVKTIVFLPLNLYFYAHILHVNVQSAKVMHRSQKVNMHLAKMFSIISLITLTTHIPGKCMQFDFTTLWKTCCAN